jgi:hypothetical protein
MNVSCGATLRRPLAALVATVGLAVAGCASNVSDAPATASTPPPVMSSTPPSQSQPPIRSWTRSMCQALGLAFLRLGTPPQADFANPAATRQAFSTYLNNASNATQQAIDLLSSIGPPPVEDGQRILDQLRMQLTQLRGNLSEAATQLNQANANEAGAIGQAFGAVGNVVGLFGTLTSDPQLRAAVDQTPECQSASG